MSQNLQQIDQKQQIMVNQEISKLPIQSSSQEQVSQQFFDAFDKLQRQTVDKKSEEFHSNQNKQLDQLLTNKYEQQKSVKNASDEERKLSNEQQNEQNLINFNLRQRIKGQQQSNEQINNSNWSGSSGSYQNNHNLNANPQNHQNKDQNDQNFQIKSFSDFNQDSNSNDQSNSELESDSEADNPNIYNGQAGRKLKYSNSSGFKKSSQLFSKPHQNLFYDAPYKNSDGKQFDEQYKRNFAHMLLEKTRGLQKHVAGQLISRQAEKIKVYANQVLIWMSIYRIVFAIEAEKARRKLSDAEIVAQVETRLIDYLNHNPNQKKYKFIKICNRTFRALRIKKCTGDYWLREIFNKYEHKLNPRIDTAFLLKKLNKNGIGGNEIGGFDIDFPIQNSRGGHYLQLKCQNSENSNRGWFPMEVKQKVIRKIDKSIQNAISRIFQEKINEFCVNSSQLKKWYIKFGRLQLFNPNTNFYQQQVASSNRPVPQFPQTSNMGNQSFLNGARRAQKQVLNFIRMNPSSTKSKVYSFACSVVQRLGVQQLSNQSNFTSWFNHILTNYCVIFNQYVQLRNNNPRQFDKDQYGNSNFQIPIGNPQIRISTLDSQMYHPNNQQKKNI